MTITVTTPDGATHEVALDAVKLPAGYTLNAPDKPAPGYVTSAFHAEKIAEAGTNGTALRNQLLADDGFFRKAATQRGIELGDDGKPVKGGKEVDAAALKTAWVRDELDPVTKKLTELQQRVRTSEIVEAGREAGIDERFLKPVTDGAPPLVVAMLSPFITESDEGVRVMMGGVPIPAGNPQAGGSPFAGIAEGVKRLAETDGFKPYLKPPDRNDSGPGYKGTNGQNGTAAKSMARAAFDALPPMQQAAHMKDGGTVTDG